MRGRKIVKPGQNEGKSIAGEEKRVDSPACEMWFMSDGCDLIDGTGTWLGDSVYADPPVGPMVMLQVQLKPCIRREIMGRCFRARS